MPRTGWAAGQAEREAVWLPRLAPHLPLALPVQVALGQPADGYPFTWSVYQWLPGDNANGTISDLRQAVGHPGGADHRVTLGPGADVAAKRSGG